MSRSDDGQCRLGWWSDSGQARSIFPCTEIYILLSRLGQAVELDPTLPSINSCSIIVLHSLFRSPRQTTDPFITARKVLIPVSTHPDLFSPSPAQLWEPIESRWATVGRSSIPRHPSTRSIGIINEVSNIFRTLFVAGVGLLICPPLCYACHFDGGCGKNRSRVLEQARKVYHRFLYFFNPIDIHL